MDRAVNVHEPGYNRPMAGLALTFTIGAALAAVGGIGEGMTVDLDAGPRLNYWFVANDQRVQYSGTADPASLKLTTDAPQRLAGKWDLDARAAGGPRVQLEFDAALLK